MHIKSIIIFIFFTVVAHVGFADSWGKISIQVNCSVEDDENVSEQGAYKYECGWLGCTIVVPITDSAAMLYIILEYDETPGKALSSAKSPGLGTEFEGIQGILRKTGPSGDPEVLACNISFLE